jgi:hypothetical protein
MTIRIPILVGLFALTTCAPLYAQMGEMGGGGGGKQKRIAACEGKSPGDPCSFTNRKEQTASGTCQTSDSMQGRKLICMSVGMKGKGTGGGMGNGGMSPRNTPE